MPKDAAVRVEDVDAHSGPQTAISDADCVIAYGLVCVFAAELVEVVNAQSGKGLAIKAGFSRENNGPGDSTLISFSVPLLHSLACMTDASMHMQCAAHDKDLMVASCSSSGLKQALPGQQRQWTIK